jgi:helix-turn-helix protein
VSKRSKPVRHRQDTLLTVQNVADILKVKPTYVVTLATRGDLPMYFQRSDVEAFIEARLVPVKPKR